MNKALLDTDIYSEVLRGVHAAVDTQARNYRQAYGRLTLSVITVMEMIKGLQKVQRPQKIAVLLTDVGAEDVLGFDQAAAEAAGRSWGDLERTGQPIGLADPMIAAIALVHGLDVVTWKHRSLPAHPATRLSAHARQLESPMTQGDLSSSRSAPPRYLTISSDHVRLSLATRQAVGDHDGSVHVHAPVPRRSIP